MEKYVTILNFSGKVCGLIDFSLLKSELAIEKSLRGTGYSLIPIYRYSDDAQRGILRKFYITG